MRLVTLAVVLSAFTCFAAPEGVVTVFHAGSLTVPFEVIESMFEEQYPDVDVQREAGGSVACARKITELDRDCDVMASADYRVIDNMLIDEYTNWNCIFATNQMVLCYMPDSRYASEINTGNWFEILGREGVEWGYSDPSADPCGYRTLLALQLAEKHYNSPGLFNELVNGTNEASIRPKSVELISLLQSGHLDYAFEYLSVAVQHDLQYLVLPAEVNLGDPDQAELYSAVSTQIAGSQPGETRTVYGAPIAYGITILDNAPNREAAEAFVAFLLSADGGLSVLEEKGQPPFVPVRVSPGTVFSEIPAEISSFTR
ncbi:MAG: molybdate ABC transporter substrate-binding protein [Gemmatimonadaceae bacterium 4484_173]|nr:MAG: molybdate ABC transporter substrate-binding protein [Gemmatimonadaceae bacterium 4484_173]RKZ01757.1 MAG: tungstate ABC transporter substrate-binding protein WtpA [Candidatus Fermentibacteria bacterium]